MRSKRTTQTFIPFIERTAVYKANDKYDKRCAYHEQWVLPKKNEEVVAALNIVKDP